MVLVVSYDDAKEEDLKTTITINKTDLDAATKNADNKNKRLVTDIINPMPGVFVDDKINLEINLNIKVMI